MDDGTSLQNWNHFGQHVKGAKAILDRLILALAQAPALLVASWVHRILVLPLVFECKVASCGELVRRFLGVGLTPRYLRRLIFSLSLPATHRVMIALRSIICGVSGLSALEALDQIPSFSPVSA